MKRMPNLKIKISYKEYEEGEGFISRAKFKLNVTKEKITIKKTFEKTQDFSQELFVRWGFGTKEDFFEEFIEPWEDEEELMQQIAQNTQSHFNNLKENLWKIK